MEGSGRTRERTEVVAMTRRAKFVLPAAAALTLGACSGGASSSVKFFTVPPPSATHTPKATGPTLPPNVTLSPLGSSLNAGPMTITVLSCGRYTAAQRAEFGVKARGGLVYAYAGGASAPDAAAALEVEFTNGGKVVGKRVASPPSAVGPGQAATAWVNAVGSAGQNLRFSGCELVSYRLRPNPGSRSARYAP
jgi:hypothetical protein